MEIYVNGEPTTVPDGNTVTDLLARYALTPERVAVEINQTLVRRATFTAMTLKSGDRVEIVTLVGGG